MCNLFFARAKVILSHCDIEAHTKEEDSWCWTKKCQHPIKTKEVTLRMNAVFTHKIVLTKDDPQRMPEYTLRWSDVTHLWIC